MGLSAALYSGTTGLKAHGEAMSVIGNNIANVSTLGFKGSRMHFMDALSQSITTAAGGGQVGRGVMVGTVMADFAQGSLETTTEATDLAIGGKGFFMVSPKGYETNYYTRAGNFRFDKDGYLVDPNGYVLQGWEVQRENISAAATTASTSSATVGVKTIGVPTDIRLENFQSPPQATTNVSMIVNVDSRAEDKSTSETDPFFALYSNWDATVDPPLGDAQYAYQSTIKVYDENGTSHNLTVYFDPVNHEDVIDAAGGKKYVEYMVTVPPNEDHREFVIDAGGDNERMRGVLMIGTLTFNTAGEIEGMTGFTINADGPDGGPYTFPADPSDLAEWTPANFSQNGYPICTANFTGAANASSTSYPGGATANPPADPKNIEINFGLRNKNLEEDPVNPIGPGWTSNSGATGGDPATYGTDPDNLMTVRDPEISALSSTTYSTGSTTLYQSQDGYGAGFLQSVSVDRDGVLVGRYSNGQVLELYALTLADFNNQYALYREGNNLFSETRSSGPPLTGLAGTAGKGSIASNSLEQSNVDLATEFVNMITTQKGFEANSKTITTTDQMLSILIQLKR
ncbi:MAG: flagellar hook protein FlgE [Deltaproteobacteria bacterium]|nr:flagellar hook protein FlgE [Deltaproteobacteria bacterium]